MRRFSTSIPLWGRGAALLLAFASVTACGRSGLIPYGVDESGGTEVGSGTGGTVGAKGGSTTTPPSGGGGFSALGGAGVGGVSSSGGTLSMGGSRVSGGSSVSGGIGAGGTRVSGGTMGTGGRSTGGSVVLGGLAAGGTRSTGGAIGAGGTGGSSTGGTGGAIGAGGTGGSSTGGTGGASCGDFKRCGGDVVGTWTVTSSCLTVSGRLDLSDVGIGCAAAQVSGALQVSGTWAATAVGRYTDKTTTLGEESLTLPPSCLRVAGTSTTCEKLAQVLAASLGYSAMVCTSAADGGCACSAKVNQYGGLGLVSPDPQTGGSFKTSGDVLTTDIGAQYDYCVSIDSMSWTPRSKSPTFNGTVVFQKTGAP
jgi:hypothetical protein